MQRIKDLQVNQMCSLPLVVVNVVARETKAKKPYLSMELFDGIETIVGNYWDWTGVNIPEKNAILDVTAQVTEYMGKKQLNIKKLILNTDLLLAAFMPSSGCDIGEAYKEAYSMMGDVHDTLLRDLAIAILEETTNGWLNAPGAVTVHHAFVGGMLVHALSVAKMSKALAELVPEANVDLAVVGGLLHDIGKIFTYKINGITIDMTSEGRLYEHSFIGAEFVGNFADNHQFARTVQDERKIRLLRHIVLSHHGEQEFGAVVTPQCIEAYIVHYADTLDASVQRIVEQSSKAGEAMWTDRIYTLNNRTHITPCYVNAVFLDEEETE